MKTILFLFDRLLELAVMVGIVFLSVIAVLLLGS